MADSLEKRQRGRGVEQVERERETLGVGWRGRLGGISEACTLGASLAALRGSALSLGGSSATSPKRTVSIWYTVRTRNRIQKDEGAGGPRKRWRHQHLATSASAERGLSTFPVRLALRSLRHCLVFRARLVAASRRQRNGPRWVGSCKGGAAGCLQTHPCGSRRPHALPRQHRCD